MEIVFISVLLCKKCMKMFFALVLSNNKYHYAAQRDGTTSYYA